MKKTLLLLTALVSASALAQETPPPPPAAPPPADTAAATAPPADAPLATDPGGRVRWGVGAGIGWHFPYSAFGMMAEGRVGYQFTNILSVYATVGANFGVGFGAMASSSGGSVSATGISNLLFSVIAEAMFADIFYVGAGPGLAYGGLAVAGLSAGTSGGSISAVAASGVKPTLDFRLGLGFGKPKPDTFRRGGFNLGINALTMFHPDAVVTRVQANSSGGSINVDTRELIVTVTPMLTLGYDAR